ncbi:hypothetical protein [Halanaeroarchaeum sp. HSR-CO]|uniref:DUF7285 family protein n=1 Tax=Halanaeroarchaeum sp. HSR-CO TaxID=2866382 RepID=UPI00217D0175|nr:hypothetical protein [Halanaeroarchaeum sp. HSR-CO]
MSSSGSRAQVEPLPALVAVSAFVAALGVYAVAFHDVPTDTDRDVATQALAAVVESASTAGVLNPAAVPDDGPGGHEMAVVVRADGSEWNTGPEPPADARSATRQVLVGTDRGEQVGRIRVWVWR